MISAASQGTNAVLRRVLDDFIGEPRLQRTCLVSRRPTRANSADYTQAAAQMAIAARIAGQFGKTICQSLNEAPRSSNELSVKRNELDSPRAAQSLAW